MMDAMGGPHPAYSVTKTMVPIVIKFHSYEE